MSISGSILEEEQLVKIENICPVAKFLIKFSQSVSI